MVSNYNYRARTANNQVVVGVVQAPSIEEAKKILLKNRLTPLVISQPRRLIDYVPFIGKVSLKDKTMFARQLAMTLEAGLSLPQAVRLMVRQTKKGKFHTIIEGLLSDIQDGFSFSSALMKYPDVFDAIFINVVRAGEATGKLDSVLADLATDMEKEVKTSSKIKGALYYPAFVMVVMGIVAAIMLTQVIPQLKDVFAGAGKGLPTSTLILIKLSDLMVNSWYWLILGAIALILGLRVFFRSETGIKFGSKYSLKLPVVGVIIVQSSMARLGRLVGMLLGSGVPLLEALRLIRDSNTNRLYQDSFNRIANDIERGVPMSVPVNDDPLFPIMVSQMVAIGEQSGKMDEVMMRMAQYYEAELSTRVDSLSSLIEPLVIVILGVAVAWLAIAVLMPIYSISSSI